MTDIGASMHILQVEEFISSNDSFASGIETTCALSANRTKIRLYKNELMRYNYVKYD